MRKVRVIKPMPFVEVGDIFEVRLKDCGLSVVVKYINNILVIDWSLKQLNILIQDGWLKEVVEEKSLSDKMKEANFNKIIDYDLLAKIAMQHAYEVAQKAREHHYKCGCCDLVLKALKQEAELNKTKES